MVLVAYIVGIILSVMGLDFFGIVDDYFEKCNIVIGSSM